MPATSSNRPHSQAHPERGKIAIGTSGWAYKAWAETFYPKDLPSSKHLAYYAQHFGTVEINATFYRLPETKTVQAWHDQSPPHSNR